MENVPEKGWMGKTLQHSLSRYNSGALTHSTLLKPETARRLAVSSQFSTVVYMTNQSLFQMLIFFFFLIKQIYS